MKKTFLDVYYSIAYNFRPLLFFELLYRGLGLAVIFPLVRVLFLLSIRLSGFSYITNTSLFDYLLKPQTLLIMMIILLILSVYIVIEMVFLSVLFDYGYHQKSLSFRDWMSLGLQRLFETTSKYRLRIIGPAFLFFMLVELFHVAGIASTINLPPILMDQINRSFWLQSALAGIFIIACFLFLETIFFINHYVIEKLSTKKSFQESRRMLKGKRLEMIIEFVLLNVMLNAVLYVLYVVIVLIVGWGVAITRGEVYALSVVLTIFYGIYSFIALLATLILIPVNYALISSWYYEEREKLGIVVSGIPRHKMKTKLLPKGWIRKGTILGLLVVFIINLLNVITLLGSPRSPLELLNFAEIVAHRGASWDAPENTLSAIELAILQGADVVEIDVRETRDMVPVLMHDATTFRTTNDPSRRRVNNMSLDELKELDAGTWFSTEFAGEKIPTLEEALMVAKGRVRVFVELKAETGTLESKVVSLLEEMDMVQDSVILSFSKNQLIRIKTLNPEIKTLLLLSSFYGDIDSLVNQDELDMFGFSESLFVNNPEYKEAIHRARKRIYVWTVNSDESLRNVVRLDADGIITDRPVRAREIAYSKNTSDLMIEILNRFFRKDTQ